MTGTKIWHVIKSSSQAIVADVFFFFFMTKGVPQGSILGPILLHTIDLNLSVEYSVVHFYADVTHIYSTAPSLGGKICNLKERFI